MINLPNISFIKQADTPLSLKTGSEEETQSLARQLARIIEEGSVLALYGDLGAGKSVFARALIRELTGQPDLEVPSPTFTLVQSYEAPGGELYHFDLYRLESPEDVYELGWEDALNGLCTLIEWPQRLGGLAPCPRLEIRLHIPRGEPDAREIVIEWIDD